MSKEAITAFDEQRTVCPTTGDFHRYFIFETKNGYEPIQVEVVTGVKAGILSREGTTELRTLYEKVEYAVLGCNCGSVIKQKVKQ